MIKNSKYIIILISIFVLSCSTVKFSYKEKGIIKTDKCTDLRTSSLRKLNSVVSDIILTTFLFLILGVDHDRIETCDNQRVVFFPIGV